MKKVFEACFYKRSIIPCKIWDTNKKGEWDPRIKQWCIQKKKKKQWKNTSSAFNETVTRTYYCCNLSTVQFSEIATKNSHKSHTIYQDYCHIYNCLHGHHWKFINFETTLKLMNFWQVIQENACSTYHIDFQYNGPKKGYQLQLCQEDGCFLQNFKYLGLSI